jgi:hypothetical protein
VENVGILAASGFIAGEALMGLGTATLIFFEIPLPSVFKNPSYAAGLAVLALMAFILIQVPLGNAGHPDEPAPPAVFM